MGEENKVRLLIDSTVYDCLPDCQLIIDKMEKLWHNGVFESVSIINNNSPFFEEDVQIKITVNKEGILDSIREEGKSPSSRIIWMETKPTFSPEYIKNFGRRIFGTRLTKSLLNTLNVFFVYLELRQSWHIQYRSPSILVTNNINLLKKRYVIESFFKKELNILRLDEAYSRLELIGKKCGIYTADDSFGRIDRRRYYYTTFTTNVRHYNLSSISDPMSPKKHILEAFATRFTLLLLAIDELGFQFYYPKETELMIPYHFNYFLSLATGLFDNLAIATKDKYNIKLQYNQPSRISLVSTSGRDFLTKVKKINPNLGTHIRAPFISLIHTLRELAIHREGFKMMGYLDPVKFVDFLRIDDEIESLIKSCHDKTEKGNMFSNWGVYKDPMFKYLESYHFANRVGKELGSFCDRYLELM